MDGVVVIDKPAGVTSHDVVDAVRKRFGLKRVGHAGTLDPDATGLLILGLGKATRLLSYAQAGPKSYRATARFGIVTSTQDASGEVLEKAEPDFDEAQLRDALEGLTGEIEQVPPMVSAVKVGGERLYRKALRGEEIERAPRKVTVHDFDLVSFESPDRAEVDVRCSGGTYVRTLIHDLGARLGCGAHMERLRRTEAGGFSLEDAVALETLSESDVRPLTDAVRELPRVDVNAEAAGFVANGRPLQIGSDARGPVAIVHGDRLLGIYRSKGAELVAERVVPQ